MSEKIRIFVALCICFFIQPSNAQLIDYGTYFTDTASNLDWLKLTQTIRHSFNDVYAKLDVGQEFSGWRYAEYSDIENLAYKNGYTGSQVIKPDGDTNYPDSSLAPLIELFGRTYALEAALDSNMTLKQWEDLNPTSTANYLTAGIIGGGYPATLNGQGARHLVEFFTALPYTCIPSQQCNGDTVQTSGLADGLYPSYGVGSYLIRTHIAINTPIPSAIWLVSSGLIGLVGFVRRRAARSQ